MTRKQGHVPVTTTLRYEETVLLREMVDRMDEARVKRAKHPETYLPGDSHRVTLTGVNRASLRFVLEHEDLFTEWLNNAPVVEE